MCARVTAVHYRVQLTLCSLFSPLLPPALALSYVEPSAPCWLLPQDGSLSLLLQALVLHNSLTLHPVPALTHTQAILAGFSTYNSSHLAKAGVQPGLTSSSMLAWVT